jgi:hypothetical protein
LKIPTCGGLSFQRAFNYDGNLKLREVLLSGVRQTGESCSEVHCTKCLAVERLRGCDATQPQILLKEHVSNLFRRSTNGNARNNGSPSEKVEWNETLRNGRSCFVRIHCVPQSQSPLNLIKAKLLRKPSPKYYRDQLTPPSNSRKGVQNLRGRETDGEFRAARVTAANK